ncbi:hypothetical protein [Leucobacter luti]|uniref:Uncharacterized protein n=1 Tax=Leucobacter luti TaxID=340320 RepID=A0A4Q7U201_9MICO|nr:hypothetical protein [Leucobacter luti]MBL3698954.1 hypothetical protein [Leucobacter luti]RZT66332.1 hypothetical protein EV139_1768 [Leucobacter luti]
MSTPDAADPQPQQDPATHPEPTLPETPSADETTADPARGASPQLAADPAVPADAAGETGAAAVAEAEAEREPIVTVVEREVTLQRSVRYGRVIVGFALLGALLGMLASLVFPVLDDANYTMGQIAGFMALIGAAIGLLLGGVLALILGAVARRSRGRGVAIQSDVR